MYRLEPAYQWVKLKSSAALKCRKCLTIQYTLTALILYAVGLLLETLENEKNAARLEKYAN